MSVRRLLAGHGRTKSYTCGKDVWLAGCSGVTDHSLVRRFEQTGTSINAQD